MAAAPGALAPRQRRSERRFSAATLRWRLQSVRTPHRAGPEPFGGRAKGAENAGTKYQRLVATTGPGRAAAVRQLHRTTPQKAHASERSSIGAGDGSTGHVWGAEVPKSTPPRFEGPLNHGRFVHNAAPPYHTLFRPFRCHPGVVHSPLRPVETASGCRETARLLLISAWPHRIDLRRLASKRLGRCVP